MSTATAASTACLQPRSLLHSGLLANVHCSTTAANSPIGYEASMSLAMDLDAKLADAEIDTKETHDHSDGDDYPEQSRKAQEQTTLSKDTRLETRTVDNGNDYNNVLEQRNQSLENLHQSEGPANGDDDYSNPRRIFHEESEKVSHETSIANKRSRPVEDVSVVQLNGNINGNDPMDDEDELDLDDDEASIAGHSLGSDGHCSYGNISNSLLSIDNSKDDDMDDDLDHHIHHGDKLHVDVTDRSRSPHHIRSPHHLHRAMHSGSRPGSSDGEYYESTMSESSQHPLQHHLHHGQTHLQAHPHHIGNPIEDGHIDAMESMVDGQSFQCHLCTFATISKYQFNLHVNTHYDHKCDHCDYTSRTEGRLKRHMKDFHSELPPGDFSPGSDGGKLSNGGCPGGNNQQNKVKTYRCKQCSYVATVKTDFWDHSKTHIKAERLLTCPKCQFVTEYKHHLEYHLRNHFGSKPFKCPKCNYSCVNKSMLNSHMKSHSNIYQYRCANCTYATKYCHSLKLHLRKYGHKPATVLNPDGSPNPMPVIDVYGTRRGPRPKKSQQHQEELYSNGGGNNGNTGSSHAFSPLQMPPVNGVLSPTTVLPFFYSGEPPSVGLLSSGFHQNNGTEGHLQQQQCSSLPKSQTPNNDPRLNGNGDGRLGATILKGENSSEKGRYHCSTSSRDALKCNLCEFSTDHHDLFTKHMLSHAAVENQDLCNLYGINSETLMQDPNHQAPMNAAAMAAVAAVLGLSSHSSQHPLEMRNHHLPNQGSTPHQGSGHEQGRNYEKMSASSPHQMHQPAFKSSTKHYPLQQYNQRPLQKMDPTNHHVSPSILPNPLEHLRGFSEQFNIQPFLAREYSAHFFQSPSSGSGRILGHRHAGGHSANEHSAESSGSDKQMTDISQKASQSQVNSPSSHQNHYQGKALKDVAILCDAARSSGKGVQSTSTSNGNVASGLGPLDLSSTKGISRNMPFHHYDPHNQLQQQYPVQFSNLQGLPSLHHRSNQGLLEIATITLDENASLETSPPSTISPTQSKNRRKGRAFKLDRICMKLQKGKGSPPSPEGITDLADNLNLDESSSNDAKPICRLNDENASDNSCKDMAPISETTKVTLCIKTEVVSDCDDLKSKKVKIIPNGKSELQLLENKTNNTMINSPNQLQSDFVAAEELSPQRVLATPAVIDDTGSDKTKLPEPLQAISGEEEKSVGDEWKEAYQCQFCDMAFKDCIMYAVHMGYHGFKDPFKCNMCGQETKDKVAFFLHIARTAHL